MSLLAEVVVEEWLNRQGYFTIRGIKLGIDEIDLVAVKINQDGTVHCRHIEVHVSVKPVGYITLLSAKKCTAVELADAVQKWVTKKYKKGKKLETLAKLGCKICTKEFVVNKFRSKEEIELIRGHGIQIHNLSDILQGLKSSKIHTVPRASGNDLLELMQMIPSIRKSEPAVLLDAESINADSPLDM